MQKAPVMKSSGLQPLDESKSNEETTHVFGKNLEERVVTNDDEKSEPIEIKPLETVKEDLDDAESIRKRKFEAITGEEDEDTIFQGDFKLFTWDTKTSNWIEKGRGQLKLNDTTDSSKIKSRLIMRVSGTHKIILNVAIKHSFFRVIASTRSSIRFTDSQNVWAASGSNANHLKEIIEERLSRAENREDEKRAKSEDAEASKKTEEDSDADDRSSSDNEDVNGEHSSDGTNGEHENEDDNSKDNNEDHIGKVDNDDEKNKEDRGEGLAEGDEEPTDCAKSVTPEEKS